MAARTTSPLMITILSILIAFSSSFRPSEAACGTAVYWGRNASEGSLHATCKIGYYKYVNIAFLTTFGGGQVPVLNLTDHCDPASGDCRGLSEEIRYCQRRHIKVLLSIGSSLGSYLISSRQDAKVVADYIWNNFLSANPNGPLGDAALDGVDFVIESPRSTLYWDVLAEYISSFSTVRRKIYLSAAPQCNRTTPYWDAAIGTGVFDYVWVQFYNNQTCDYGGGRDILLQSWNQWSDALPEGGQLFLGLLPVMSPDYSGYIPPQNLIDDIFPAIKLFPNYGGIMVFNRYLDVMYPYSPKVNVSVCRKVPHIEMVPEKLSITSEIHRTHVGSFSGIN